MKILQIITELTPAGAEKIVCELCKALTENNEVIVVSLMPFPENDLIYCELCKNGINVVSLNLTKWTLWKICTLRKIINKLKPDIVG